MKLHKDNCSWDRWVCFRMGMPAYGEPQGKVRVKITVYRGKEQDPDNAVASVKPILDALVEAGWLRDDTSEWLVLEVEEVKGTKKKDRRTVIELEDGLE
jgi:Holliday junction resolvase RusA-like endonuclease